jgi:hypothetical protein
MEKLLIRDKRPGSTTLNEDRIIFKVFFRDFTPKATYFIYLFN